MSLRLLPASVRRLLAPRPAPRALPRPAPSLSLDPVERALYRLVEPMCAGLDAVDYARRIVSHPSVVLHRHALARLNRQRNALRDAYHAADEALASVIQAVEEASRESA